MDRRSERGQATRGHIVATATQRFTVDGYAGTSIEAVLRDTGLSRGALYHHFPSKEALFTAVLEAVEATIADAVRDASRSATDPLGALLAGCGAWLRLARDPTVRQVVLIDAPAVVGWQAWRAIDERHGLGLLRAGLAMAAAGGLLRQELVDVYAHMLLAVLVELALMVARAEDAAAAVETGELAVGELLRRLLVRSAGHGDDKA